MDYDFPLWEASRHHVCPPDAGPHWKKACDEGIDMTEIADNLKLSVEQRLEKHHRRMVDFLKREEFFAAMQRGHDFAKRVEAQMIHRKPKI